MVIGPQAEKPLSGGAGHAACGADAGQCFEPRPQLAIGSHDARTNRVPAAGHRQLEGEHAVDIEAGFDNPQFRDAPREQAGPGDEDHGERQLGDHEGPARPWPRPHSEPTAAVRPPVFSACHGIGALCAGERREPERTPAGTDGQA